MNNKTIKLLNKYNLDLYNHQASSWDKTRNKIWEKEIINFVRSIKENQKILDIGCGNARLYQILKDKSIKYTGIDNSEKLIEIDRNKYPDINFIKENALNIKYKNEFDYIFAIAVLHHIPSEKLQQTFINKCYQALKNNGQLLLIVWNRWQTKYKKYFNTTKSKTIKNLNKNDLIVPWKNTGHYRYVYAFNKTELMKLFKNSKFKNYTVTYSKDNKKVKKNQAYHIFSIAKK